MSALEPVAPPCALHHVAYVARDREEGVALLTRTYGLEAVTTFELPQYTLRGAFLAGASGLVEVIELTDPALAARRLEGVALRLDHLAFAVDDLDAEVAHLHRVGARLFAPDDSPLAGPVELAGARHVWTRPPGDAAVVVQLVELPGDGSGP